MNRKMKWDEETVPLFHQKLGIANNKSLISKQMQKSPQQSPPKTRIINVTCKIESKSMRPPSQVRDIHIH